MRTQVTLTQGTFSLMIEQIPPNNARINLYVGKYYITSFDITNDQLRDILYCMTSEQKRYIDQSKYDKEWFSKHGWHIVPYKS